MNILMLTNIYTPHVGGITRSIQAFSRQFRKRGHRVRIVAPRSSDQPDDEPDVTRYPAISNVFQQRYSLPLPAPTYLHSTMKEFQPDVIHAHHPFLLGSVAQREASLWDVPLIYTHHTRYDLNLEKYTSLPVNTMNLLVHLWTGFCNLCDGVIAPSESIAELLRERGVQSRILVIPTGVDVSQFSTGNGADFREEFGIPKDAVVVGYVGRLAPEKNLHFLTRATIEFLQRHTDAHFLVVGEGKAWPEMERQLTQEKLLDRSHYVGVLEMPKIADAYHAMDVFAFASESETQGMVVTEAMAAGVPVVAVKASGVRDVLRDGENGRMVGSDNVASFVEALEEVAYLDVNARNRVQQAARATAEHFSIDRCAERNLQFYETVIRERKQTAGVGDGFLAGVSRFLEYEWNAWSNIIEVAGQSLFGIKKHDEED